MAAHPNFHISTQHSFSDASCLRGQACFDARALDGCCGFCFSFSFFSIDTLVTTLCFLVFSAALVPGIAHVNKTHDAFAGHNTPWQPQWPPHPQKSDASSAS